MLAAALTEVSVSATSQETLPENPFKHILFDILIFHLFSLSYILRHKPTFIELITFQIKISGYMKKLFLQVSITDWGFNSLNYPVFQSKFKRDN